MKDLLNIFLYFTIMYSKETCCCIFQAKEHIVAITQQLKSGSLSSESATKFSMLVSMLRHCKHDTLKEVVQTIQAIQNDDAR